MFKVIAYQTAQSDIVRKLGDISDSDGWFGYTVYETKSPNAIILNFWHTTPDMWVYASGNDAMPHMIELANEMRTDLEIMKMIF